MSKTRESTTPVAQSPQVSEDMPDNHAVPNWFLPVVIFLATALVTFAIFLLGVVQTLWGTTPAAIVALSLFVIFGGVLAVLLWKYEKKLLGVGIALGVVAGLCFFVGILLPPPPPPTPEPIETTPIPSTPVSSTPSPSPKLTPDEQLYTPTREGSPSTQDIRNTKDIGTTEVPKPENYLPKYQIVYLHAEKENYVYAHKQASLVENETYLPNAYHGARATVLAEQNGFSCILYYSSDNEQRAAWVKSDHLNKYYPGSTMFVGEPVEYREYVAEPEVSWSKLPFENSEQNFTDLKNPVENCVAFTLDYQVFSRNKAATKEILGPRTIYVHNGKEWIEVGYFDYSELGPVHVVVTLEQAITLKAVATVASCAKPDTFLFRQSLLDVYVR